MATPSVKQKSTVSNTLKWLLVCVIVIAAVVGNLYFSSIPLAVRSAVLIVVAVLTLWLAKTTTQGGVAWVFLKNARLEMRKVVWPTRQETLQTTALVIGVVVLLSLLLWGIDSLFALIVSSIVI